MTHANTLFLRLEGPLQAWGDTSKFVMRRTMNAPTKSGVIGLLCAALGLTRSGARDRLNELAMLRMGVRVDRPGTRWWDYHTVGAGIGLTTAGGGIKTGVRATLVTRREYLCDASFLVALQGDGKLIDDLYSALSNPRWPVYLGRKCCPPSRPVMDRQPGHHEDLLDALRAVPWQKRLKDDPVPESVEALFDWAPTPNEPEAPADADVWYDVPVSFEPPYHIPRFVVRRRLAVGDGRDIAGEKAAMVSPVPRPPRPRADYRNAVYRAKRADRLVEDRYLCVFCKCPATTVQHITYRRAGGDEAPEDLRALCRLCHDAVTMLEYGARMGLDRINPEDPHWRERIIEKRRQIIQYRSLETRRRRLTPEEVE